MRIRRLADQNKHVPAEGPLLLAPRVSVTLVAGEPYRLELDLAARVDHGAALLLVPLPALLAAGIMATPELIVATDPLLPLRISLYPLRAANLHAGEVVVRGIVLDAPTERFYEDGGLDAALAGPGLNFESGEATEERADLRFEGDPTE